MTDFNYGNLDRMIQEPYQKYLPNVFDESLGLHQQVHILMEQINIAIDAFNTLSTNVGGDILEFVGLFNALKAQFELLQTSTVPENLTAILNAWMLDGTLNDILALTLLDRDRVYASQFGLKNDNTDTVTAFIEACTFCNNNGKSLYLPIGEYNIPGNHVIPGCSIIGEQAGQVKINIMGDTYFDTSAVTSIAVENIDFMMYNNALSDSDDKASKKELFWSSTDKERVSYRNLKFIGSVASTSGLFRYKGAIRDGCTVSGIIENIEFQNIAACVNTTSASKNYIIRNLQATNFETLVYSRGSYYDVKTITGINTLTQMMIWLQKNHLTSPQTLHNGLDLVLCEGNNYNLKDLKGVNCIERVIYSQGSDVTADNLWGSNCDGFKFVGVDGANISSNIHISNTWFEVNTDLVALGRTKVNEFTFYWAKNITVENTISSDGTASGTNPIRSIVNVYRYVKNLTLKNMFSTYTENSFLYVALKNTNEFEAEYPSPIDENYIVLDTCVIDNCSVKKNSRRNGSLLSIRTAESSATIMTKYGLRNITIKESKVDYGATKDDFIYEWAYCDGFYGQNNRANTLGYWNSGLPNVAYTKANNIVLKEHNLLFSSIPDFFTQLGVVLLTKGSEFTVNTIQANRTYRIKVTVDNNTQLTAPVLINQGSRVECDLFLDGVYLSIANFPTNCLIEATDNAGGYHLQKVVAGVATTLVGASFVTTTAQLAIPTLLIRGDQKTVPFNVKIKAMLGT